MKKWKSTESTAWNVLFVYCILIAVIQSFVVVNEHHFGITAPHVSVRKIHALAALFVLSLLRAQKKIWSRNRCVAVYLLLFSPVYYFHWETEIATSGLKEWVPYMSFKYQILVGAFLIIGFRFRDKMVIENLSRQRARSEIHEKVARIFMSMRDKMNTPLQTQNFVVQILKKNTSAVNQVMDPLEKSVQTLSDVNTIIGRLQSDLPETSYKLMTENEISEFLDDLESKRAKIT